MATRFEVVLEHDDTFFFQLRTADGNVALRSLASNSKIMTQNEILHLRKAMQDESLLVPHVGADDSHFLVIKDQDGSVLARSSKTRSAAELKELTQTIRDASHSPIIDLTKKHRVQAN